MASETCCNINDAQVITVLQILPSNLTAAEHVRAELSRWESNYIDVAALKAKAEQAERDKETLAEKLTILDRRIQVSHMLLLLQESDKFFFCSSRLSQGAQMPPFTRRRLRGP
jgi:hypothetical protein